MARLTTRDDLIEYLKRRLGGGVGGFLPVEISDNQYEVVVDDALQFCHENVYDFLNSRIYVIETVDGQLSYTLPDNIFAVTEVLSYKSYSSFGYARHSGVTSQEIEFIRSLGNISNGFLDSIINIQNFNMFRSNFIAEKTWKYNSNSQEFILYSNPGNGRKMALMVNEKLDADGNQTGLHWDNKFLKEYSLALAKIIYGTNLTKFSGVSLPGGGEVNGEAILESGKEEKERLEEYARESLCDPSYGVPIIY